jgi:hypothetical protein
MHRPHSRGCLWVRPGWDQGVAGHVHHWGAPAAASGMSQAALASNLNEQVLAQPNPGSGKHDLDDTGGCWVTVRGLGHS